MDKQETEPDMNLINRSYCNDKCRFIQVSRSVYGARPYSNGFKFCKRCSVFMKTSEIQCPCCGMRLRVTPTNVKAIKVKKILNKHCKRCKHHARSHRDTRQQYSDDGFCTTMSCICPNTRQMVIDGCEIVN